MVEHILVATDLTHRSEPAIARAVELSKRFEAAMTLLHVVEHDQPEAYIARELEHAQEALTEESARLRATTGSPVDVRVLAGDTLETIGDVASHIGVDLIVLGRHRRRILRDLFVGTTAERVIWRGTHPVLMVKQSPAGQYRRIGVMTDCSEPSAKALRVAEALGLLSDAVLAVIHARLAFAKTTLAAHATAQAMQDHIGAEIKTATVELREFLEEQGRRDLLGCLVVREGDPMTVIRAFIEEQEPDLLVMGTHGRTGIGRLLLGSVADEALRSLDLDILAVPVQAEV
ncbi:universal stress protein [Sphingobium sp. D43FB]|uniref:universal stress protein n=1 Tax=Sphingobium sp. D43FB TaxID=2017595 RepID=UPI000BB54D37|nr:universal stress protein [Sphingobium sp. D43FB]PBN41397.1 universal stress protein UspA [Sphingobium sp. D43FB]